MSKEIFEIIEEVVKSKSRTLKIKVLRENNIMPLRDVLQGTFDPNIQWNLPEGAPPFTENKPESCPSSLRRQHKFFKYFVKGLRESENLTKMKREKMFIDSLEAVHPKDAKIMLSMVSKKSPGKGITKKLVEEAFPDLIR